MTTLGPVVLAGTHVRLEPLRPHHAGALLQAGQAPAIWAWMSARPTTPEAMQHWIATALQAEAAGQEYAFAVVLQASGRVVGSTRFMEVQPAHRGAEVGWTWYAPDTWGTVVNPEAKFLLLCHAFESWGAKRMQLKTDGNNTRSQAAIAKLGAQREGTLRNHRIRPDGTMRDTVMFSILDHEWPLVKAGLLQRIASHA